MTVFISPHSHHAIIIIIIIIRISNKEVKRTTKL